MDLSRVVVYALAAFWIWFVLSQARPPVLWRVGDALRRLPRGPELVGCPWCLGSWCAALVVAVGEIGRYDWRDIIGWLAVAGIVGLIGSNMPDDGEPS